MVVLVLKGLDRERMIMRRKLMGSGGGRCMFCGGTHDNPFSQIIEQLNLMSIWCLWLYFHLKVIVALDFAWI